MIPNEDNLKRPRFLEGKKVFLTPMFMEDVDRFYLWQNDRELLFVGGPSVRPMTMEQTKERLKKSLSEKDNQHHAIIDCKSGEFVGFAVIFSIDESSRVCEWGLLLDSSVHRQGIATEVGEMVLRYIFVDMGMQKVKSSTHSGNEGSIRLQEKLGMVHEGNGRRELYIRSEYYDDVRYGMLREEFFDKYGEGN